MVWTYPLWRMWFKVRKFITFCLDFIIISLTFLISLDDLFKKLLLLANGFHKFVRPDMDAEAVPTIVDASSQYSTLSKIESLKLEKQKDISLGLDRNGTDRTVGRIGTSKSPSS